MWHPTVRCCRLLALAGLMVGCGDDASDVTGRAYFQYLGSESVPRDLSNLEFRAYVQESAQGFLSYPAVTGTSTGTFTIKGVKDGPLLLRVVSGETTSWSEHDSHELDFETFVLGRPGLESPMLATPLNVRATGLDAWSSSDELYIDCWENGTEASGLQARLSPAPVDGVTALDGEMDWNSAFVYSFGPSGRPALMSMDAGDTLTISRTRSEQLGGIAVQTLTQIASGSAPTQTDGQPSMFDAAFETPTQSQLVHFIGDLPSVRDQLRGTQDTTWSITLMRGPGAAVGLRMGPPLLELRGTGLGTPLDVSHAFGDPFDPAWDLVVDFYGEQLRSLQIPGLSAAVSFPDAISVRRRVATLEQTISSPVGILAGLAINNVVIDDGAVVPWNGSSPLTFSAHLPTGVSGFDISLLSVSESTTAEVVHLHSLRDEITVPSDGLVAGQAYVVQATLAYDDGDTVAASRAVWGPVSFQSK